MENNDLEWKKFTTRELEIMLPRTFIGGDPKKDKKTIEEKIAKIPKKYRIYYKNFFKEKLNNADVIFCYLMPFQLKKLALKIKKECKKGTQIVSNTFKIEGLNPEKIIVKNPIEKTPTLYFYKI